MVRAFTKTSLVGIAALGLLVTSCAGKDGEPGPKGEGCTVVDNGDGTKTITCDDGTSATISDGQDVDGATVEEILAQIDKLGQTEPEACVVCHEGAGEHHQAVYDAYVDQSALAMTIDSVVSTDNGDGTFGVAMYLTIEMDGAPFLDADGLPSLAQKRFYAVRYVDGEFFDSVSFSNPVALGGGEYRVNASASPFAPEATGTDAIVYAYVAEGSLHTEQPAGSHVHLYDNVASAGLSFGAAATYESAANASGCEKCHGSPYMKHGYRAAQVAGLADFAACKTCHFDDRNGGHEDWQILADDPARFAEVHAGADLTVEEEAKYAYTANIMNDVHMSHAMEFPYPQSMANCVTCHEGKLDVILADEFFTKETCVSCHSVDGFQAVTPESHNGYDETTQCMGCHQGMGGFQAIHAGYNTQIFAAEGVKYADLFPVSIDSANYDAASNTLNVVFSVTEEGSSTVELNAEDIVPTILIGLYGYDTKDFIVAAHGRDADRNRLLEFVIDGESTNPRFTVVQAANGTWEINADLSMWADMIGDSVRRAEISVQPKLTDAEGTVLALNAKTSTFDLLANQFDDAFYAPIVDVNKCNSCHEALATTFHSPDRGGSVVACRMCHVTSSRGSHLEMQSRSIDSYVHAIHSFQAFDPGDIDFTNPAEAVKYELHVNHTYPEFTIMDCESCHNPGTYDVPDQSKSLPGVLSGSDDVAGRQIRNVPQVVTGPATRACGSCHRSDLINADDANGLAALNAHMKANGYIIEDETGVWEAIVATIMGLFN